MEGAWFTSTDRYKIVMGVPVRAGYEEELYRYRWVHTMEYIVKLE